MCVFVCMLNFLLLFRRLRGSGYHIMKEVTYMCKHTIFRSRQILITRARFFSHTQSSCAVFFFSLVFQFASPFSAADILFCESTNDDYVLFCCTARDHAKIKYMILISGYLK